MPKVRGVFARAVCGWLHVWGAHVHVVCKCIRCVLCVVCRCGTIIVEPILFQALTVQGALHMASLHPHLCPQRQVIFLLSRWEN